MMPKTEEIAIQKGAKDAQSSIKMWAEDDRPREKLAEKGAMTLSTAELLAILLGSGSRTQSAVDLAKTILQTVDNDLNCLAAKNLRELQVFKGVGTAKAVTILAAMELSRRKQDTATRNLPQIKSSEDAYRWLAPLLAELDHEQFWILMLNRANKVIARACISRGGVAATVVDPKMIFKPALEVLASGIILCHNHPSGNLTPSQADLDITKKLKLAGNALDINVLDHLIISHNGFYSFADENVL